MKKCILIIVLLGIVFFSYSVFSKIRSYCKVLPTELLKNQNVLNVKNKVQTKDFEEVYELEIEMLDHTVVKFHGVQWGFWGNIKFSCIQGIDEYCFSYFRYDKKSSKINHIQQAYMFEKSIDRYLNSHDINVVLNNYQEIKKASDRILEFSEDEYKLFNEIYNEKKDASNWINLINKNYLYESKNMIEGCYKFRVLKK